MSSVARLTPGEPAIIPPMTFFEVTYRYQNRLGPHQWSALEKLKGQLYGFKGFRFDERQNQITVSYDASRIQRGDVEKALRAAGVAIIEEVVPA